MVHVTWSFHSICFPPSYCGDEAVQYKSYLPSSHCRITSPLFHRNPFTLAIVCLSMHRHSNAKPLQQYLNRTLQLSAHFTWRFDCQHSAVTLPTLRQDYKCPVVKNSAVWLRVFSIFENPPNDRRQDCEHDGEIMNNDGGADTTCEFVNLCSSQLVVVAPSSSVKGALERKMALTDQKTNTPYFHACQ